MEGGESVDMCKGDRGEEVMSGGSVRGVGKVI